MQSPGNATRGVRRRQTFGALLLLVAVVTAACSGNVDNSQAAHLEVEEIPPALALVEPPVLRIVEPADGATVTSPVRLEVEVDNFSLAEKGVSLDGEGHFHIIADISCVIPGDVITDEHHHVGSGDSFTEIELEPGRHDLCVQIGDGFHTAVAISSTISITVAEDN